MIGHCVSPQAWREIDAHGKDGGRWGRGLTGSVSDSVLVLVDGSLLGLLEHATECVDGHVAVGRLSSGDVIETIEHLTRHLHSDSSEDITQLQRQHVVQL